MKDDNKTKKELLKDLAEARGLIKKLEESAVERKKIDDAYKTLMTNSIQGVLIIQDSKIVFANLAFVEMSGYSIGELFSFTTDNIKTSIFEDDRDVVWRDLKKRLTGKNAPSRYEFRLIKKDGSMFWVESLASFVDYRNKPAIQMSFIDITDLKKAEDNLKGERNRAELYLDILSHDIINNNQGIISSSEILLLNPDLPDNLKKYVRNSISQARATSQLITNVKKLSELSKLDVKPEGMDATTVIADSIERIHKMFPDKKIQFNFPDADSKVLIKGNRYMKDAVSNILINAVKSNRGEDVVVDILSEDSKPDNFWKFEFKDNGPGVPDEVKTSIFSKIDDSTETVQGSRLGLRLVKKFVDGCGGKVWVEDKIKGEPDKGSNFILMLPKAKKEAGKKR
jgi:PAS domain S-box-containing protein